jgi:mannose-6-phosphate isomerase-like protein (cupin superfamily)
MEKYKVFRPEEIKPFVMGDYQSRVLLDNFMAGEKCVNVNHGVFAPGGSNGKPGEKGAAHEKAEVYFGVSGEADVYLDGEPTYITQGTLIYIPGGVGHFVVNRSQTEPFVLITIWGDEKDNETHAERVKAWGTSYIRADG